MDERELKMRTKQFALRVIKLVDALPRTVAGRGVGNQLFRSGTSVAANYRAACRARSKREFVAKPGIVEEESDESGFWMEVTMEADLLKPKLVQPLHDEASQLTAIISASRLTASRRLSIENRKSKIENP